MKPSGPSSISTHCSLGFLGGVVQVIATLGKNIHTLHQALIPTGIVPVLARQLLAFCNITHEDCQFAALGKCL